MKPFRPASWIVLGNWSATPQRLRLVSWILVACGTLIGCTGEDSSSGGGTTPGASKGVIGVSLQNLTNPFFMVIADNLRDEAAKHGYTVDLQSGEDNVARQRNQIQDFIVKKAVAIVLNPKDSKAIGPAIVAANEAGIPIFTVDIRCLDPTAKVVAHIGTDNYNGGRFAGEAMIEALGEAGGKVVLLDYEVAESCIERERGFKDVLKEHNASGKPGKLELVAELPSGGTRDQGFRSASDAIQAHPDIVGIFAINDPSALGARAALEKAGKADQVKIVGFDGQPEGKKAIKEGKIYADPIQFPDRMGRETAKSIAKYLNGEPVEPSVDIATELYRKADAEKDPEIN